MSEFNFNGLQGPFVTAQTQLPQQQPQVQVDPTYSTYPQLQELPQPQMMPTPSAAPWNLDTMPWTLASTSAVQPGGVMHFSGNTLGVGSRTTQGDIVQRRSQLHQKRKSNMVVAIPPKQFISEEKITAHFNGLHISSNYQQGTPTASYNDSYKYGPSTSRKSFEEDYKITTKELEEKLKNASRITVCEEIKKLHEEEKRSTYLPEVFMNRIVQPCTALVLWKPPPIVELLRQDLVSGGTPATQRQEDISDLDLDDYSDTSAGDAEIDDFLDNNNTCNLDFNNLKADGMDEDL